MPRKPRIDIGNVIYHVINRGALKAPIFHTEQDYYAFLNLLVEAQERFNMRILGYCLMPNHWHLILYPQEDGMMSQFMKWLTGTHAQRWRTFHKNVGIGHLYQDRYKSFIVSKDSYLLQLLKYIERNPLRAQLVQRAEGWQWSSVTERINNNYRVISQLPIDLPPHYLEWINETEAIEIVQKIDSIIFRSKGRPRKRV